MVASHNLADYSAERESFSWDDIYAEADWDAPAELNIGHEVADRHASDRGKVALYQVDTNGELTTMTFWELAGRSSQFANAPDDLGVEKGDRVSSYMPRIPERYVALVGTLKHGAVWGGVNERFRPDGEWYLSGDLANKDEDGYFWFEGRADDVILSSGYRIGPFEAESSLGEYEAVAESAVVPKPHRGRGNIVKAYIVLSDDTEPSENLKEDIKTHVKEELSAHEYPREIEFRGELPKTVTGKIRRTELRDKAGEEMQSDS